MYLSRQKILKARMGRIREGTICLKVPCKCDWSLLIVSLSTRVKGNISHWAHTLAHLRVFHDVRALKYQIISEPHKRALTKKAAHDCKCSPKLSTWAKLPDKHLNTQVLHFGPSLNLHLKMDQSVQTPDEAWKSNLATSTCVTWAPCEETWAGHVAQIPTVLFHRCTPCPHRPSVEPSGVSPQGSRSWTECSALKRVLSQSSLFLLTFNEGMSDAASWRAQENSEWNQAESAVPKLWISLITGEVVSVFYLFNTVYNRPWGDHTLHKHTLVKSKV